VPTSMWSASRTLLFPIHQRSSFMLSHSVPVFCSSPCLFLIPYSTGPRPNGTCHVGLCQTRGRRLGSLRDVVRNVVWSTMIGSRKTNTRHCCGMNPMLYCTGKWKEGDAAHWPIRHAPPLLTPTMYDTVSHNRCPTLYVIADSGDLTIARAHLSVRACEVVGHPITIIRHGPL
jgi:hypothetical protein